MSTAPRWTNPPLEVPADPGGLDARTPEIASVGVSWRVSRASLGDAAPEGGSRLVRLTVSVFALDARAELFIEDPATGVRVSPVPGATVSAEVIHDIRGQAHIEAPGWLHATIEMSSEGWRLVYARTPMLDTLGIPGGRAEPTGVDVC